MTNKVTYNTSVPRFIKPLPKQQKLNQIFAALCAGYVEQQRENRARKEA
jgi:hypothetical protein